ncbi:MAG: TolC family protein [Bdellovibrionaceae bacterium]|nr:TolC family protein [Pseudobdellovibrionaceae bacterium]
MESRFWHIAIVSALLLQTQVGLGEVLQLSPQEVINQVIEQSLEVQDIELATQAQKSAEDKSYSGLDWGLESAVSYIDSREVNLQAFTNEQDKTLSYNLGLNKTFLTGTMISVNFQRQSRQSVLNPLVTTNNPSFANARTADRLSVNLSQDLWQNAFGKNFQRAVESGAMLSSKADLNKLEQLEELTLQTLKTYWSTYVAKENLKSSLAAKQRFEDLTKTVRSKTRLGYSNPGELNISLAELEEKKQKVKRDSALFIEKMRELFRLLNKPLPEDLQFSVNKDIPSPQELPKHQIDKLREIEIINLNLKIAENNLLVKKNKYQPELKISAEATFTGADEKPQESWRETLGGDRPVYSTGLTLKVPLQSRSLQGEIKELLYTRDKTRIELKIAEDKLKNKIANLYDNVMANYMIAKSFEESHAFRQKAASEIEKAYRQGRSDISVLVQAFNALSETEAQKIKIIGDYHISLNELAASLDSLILSYKSEVNTL